MQEEKKAGRCKIKEALWGSFYFMFYNFLLCNLYTFSTLPHSQLCPSGAIGPLDALHHMGQAASAQSLSVTPNL